MGLLGLDLAAVRHDLVLPVAAQRQLVLAVSAVTGLSAPSTSTKACDGGVAPGTPRAHLTGRLLLEARRRQRPICSTRRPESISCGTGTAPSIAAIL
jgi:hypothetical protein